MEDEKPIDENISLIIPEDVEQIYITGALGGFTTHDFRLITFNEVIKPTNAINGAVNLVRESKQVLVMAPTTAKELRNWLDMQIKEYEANNGEIKLILPKE